MSCSSSPPQSPEARNGRGVGAAKPGGSETTGKPCSAAADAAASGAELRAERAGRRVAAAGARVLERVLKAEASTRSGTSQRQRTMLWALGITDSASEQSVCEPPIARSSPPRVHAGSLPADRDGKQHGREITCCSARGQWARTVGADSGREKTVGADGERRQWERTVGADSK
mmetsp:Transcript_16880/g.38993  ORF Transcript_16880/g.38993 Transcript_16880/m.38993 type:complete len:173 (-) Transcript_16880:28-546(-)